MINIMEDDGDDKDDTKRRTRNLSEKKRRDQFNMLVNELSSMISTNNRKMDKSTVLKSTISFLKNHNEITVRSRAHDIQDDWKPLFLSNEEFTYLVLEALEGFIMVFSASGRIHYVSDSVKSLLGHNPMEIVDKSIFDLTFEEDRSNLYNVLQNPSMANCSQQAPGKENEVRFQCHVRRGALDFRDETTYELIQFNGHFRSNTEQKDNDEVSQQQDPDSRLLFVCTGRLYTPQLIRDVTLVDSNRSEFTSRHSLEWKFLFLDHRAPPIIGYLPFEVLGTSGYDYYHFDDLEKVVTCHEALMEKGELTSCYYRFLTKGQQWIWLQTRFYITYHQWNSKPEFVVCTHRVVSNSEIVKNSKRERIEAESAAEVDVNQSTMKEAPSDETIQAALSPAYMSDASDAFNNGYPRMSQPQSVKSGSVGCTTATVASSTASATVNSSWPRASRARFNDSDTSASGESRSSQWNSSHHETYKVSEPVVVPQHSIGAQYLNPAPYVGTVSTVGALSAVGLSGVLPLPIPSLPVIVTPDQAQIQLQRKHEELQQMIVRQQEELRQVKEQLLLTRLGILQPLVNVPNQYGSPEVQGQGLPAQIVYERTPPRSITNYPSQQPPQSSGSHQHMPQ